MRKHEKTIIAGNPSGKKQEENIIFILKYIEQHLNTITLKELSAFFNYSDRQITRILKDYTGKTFTELLQESRLSRACELLKQPNASIHSINKLPRSKLRGISLDLASLGIFVKRSKLRGIRPVSD